MAVFRRRRRRRKGGKGYPGYYSPKSFMYRNLPVTRSTWIGIRSSMRTARSIRTFLSKPQGPEVVEVLKPGESLSIGTIPREKRRKRA